MAQEKVSDTQTTDDVKSYNVVQLQISPTQLISKKRSQTTNKALTDIVNTIDGLYNSGGGTAKLKYERSPPGGHLKQLVRTLEQRLHDCLGTITVAFDINFKYCHSESLIKVIVTTQTKTEEMRSTKYNTYLPSDQQVMEVLPSDESRQLRAILMQTCPPGEPIEARLPDQTFVKGECVHFFESKITQFKHLKDTNAKNTCFATRLVGNANKFKCYVSAFANYRGGHMYYGINDEGEVVGELLCDDEKEKVRIKIKKEINKMLWPKKPADGEIDYRWNVDFVPVKDMKNKDISSLYVVVVFIAQCRGCVFADAPECYEIVDNKLKKVDFASWKKSFMGSMQEKGKMPMKSLMLENEIFKSQLNEKTKELETLAGKVQELEKNLEDKNYYINKLEIKREHEGKNSKVSQADTVPEDTCCADVPLDVVYETLTSLLNNNCNENELNEASITAQRKYKFSNVNLICLSKYVSYHLRKGQYDLAEKKLTQYAKILSSTSNNMHFKIIEQYLHSVMERCKRKYKKSYETAKKSLGDLAKRSFGIISPAFYVQIATLETILAMKENDQKARRLKMKEAEKNYDTASRHLNETAESATKAEYQQKIYINKALLHLCCSLSGDMIHDSEEIIDIKSAKQCLMETQEIILSGYPLSKFRKIQHLLAEGCLHFRLMKGVEVKARKISLLEGALNNSKEATALAEQCGYVEMKSYAERYMKFFQNKKDGLLNKCINVEA